MSTYQNIGDEHAVKLALLQKLGQFGPVLDVVEVPGAVSRVSPKPGRLVPAAAFDKGVYYELLLDLHTWTIVGAAQPGVWCCHVSTEDRFADWCDTAY